MSDFATWLATQVASRVAAGAFLEDIAFGLSIALAIIAIFVGLYAADKERHKKAHDWLKQCRWGVGDLFPDLKTERKQLQAAQ